MSPAFKILLALVCGGICVSAAIMAIGVTVLGAMGRLDTAQGGAINIVILVAMAGGAISGILLARLVIQRLPPG